MESKYKCVEQTLDITHSTKNKIYAKHRKKSIAERKNLNFIFQNPRKKPM